MSRTSTSNMRVQELGLSVIKPRRERVYQTNGIRADVLLLGHGITYTPPPTISSPSYASLRVCHDAALRDQRTAFQSRSSQLDDTTEPKERKRRCGSHNHTVSLSLILLPAHTGHTSSSRCTGHSGASACDNYGTFLNQSCSTSGYMMPPSNAKHRVSCHVD